MPEKTGSHVKDVKANKRLSDLHLNNGKSTLQARLNQLSFKLVKGENLMSFLFLEKSQNTKASGMWIKGPSLALEV